ncbi:MAG: phenol hydroxylase [Gammaproteobacteria bacterium]
MSVDLRTIAIEPQRHTFDHLARRFGDKPASRYQEGSYDIQATENLHYRPTWDPDQALYDPALSRVRMTDWYAIKDPRQFYYSTYTITRARQQDTAEANFDFVESRNLLDLMPPPLQANVAAVLLPLRHAAWAGNQVNAFICGYGYGVTFTQPAIYYAMDCLGIAQYLSRLGLLLGGPEALAQAKQAWTDAPAWQPLRHLAEDAMALRDPVEAFVAWNVAVDGLTYPLVYAHIVDDHFAAAGGAAIAMLTQFMTGWFGETQKWIDAAVRTMADESAENRAVLSTWYAEWTARAAAALDPVAALALGDAAGDAVAEQRGALATRMQKNGLAV